MLNEEKSIGFFGTNLQNDDCFLKENYLVIRRRKKSLETMMKNQKISLPILHAKFWYIAGGLASGCGCVMDKEAFAKFNNIIHQSSFINIEKFNKIIRIEKDWVYLDRCEQILAPYTAILDNFKIEELFFD
ncbi:MAG TPA: hypothetical protein QF753_00835 [Victivallales bacterium]|nr:hypothetical protein [Victivallales bacterium]|tara:strand:- start:182 stop:574 length:393 start_codon:yes stop_codon:yes gene_type:complete